jgi:hypothetical protein
MRKSLFRSNVFTELREYMIGKCEIARSTQSRPLRSVVQAEGNALVLNDRAESSRAEKLLARYLELSERTPWVARMMVLSRPLGPFKRRLKM